MVSSVDISNSSANSFADIFEPWEPISFNSTRNLFTFLTISNNCLFPFYHFALFYLHL